MATTTPTTVQVTVCGHTLTYPLLADRLHAHLAEGGLVGILHTFLAKSRHTLTTAEWAHTVVGWTAMDGSGLAYLVEVTATDHVVVGAAPMPGTPPQALYTA
jgi:hypothetical protein